MLIKHFRHATRAWHWEFPRGLSEGLDCQAEALRELYEELGTEATNITLLGQLHPDTGLTPVLISAYLADIPKVGKLQAAEGIGGFRLVTMQDTNAMIASGELTDGVTISTIALIKARAAE